MSACAFFFYINVIPSLLLIGIDHQHHIITYHWYWYSVGLLRIT